MLVEINASCLERFDQRGRRQAEQVELIRALWANETVDFEGRWDRIPKAGINPRPAREIPLWFGGTAFLPLAYKSYVSMSRMKALQPEMVKLRERHGEDRQKLNQEMMALYKREKVNPVSGCLPMILQIPVFFALYKVLFVTIEMRHQPFFGWIRDLSTPDPTSIFNAFGLIPFQPPDFLLIGIWPLLMGLSMFLQQRMNPQPPDPIQAKIFLFMPIFFTFLLARFPAGLVIYWTVNNVLTIGQQWFIMRRTRAKT